MDTDPVSRPGVPGGLDHRPAQGFEGPTIQAAVYRQLGGEAGRRLKHPGTVQPAPLGFASTALALPAQLFWRFEFGAWSVLALALLRL